MNRSEFTNALTRFDIAISRERYKIRWNNDISIMVQRVLKEPKLNQQGLGVLANVMQLSTEQPYADVGLCWIVPGYGAAPWTAETGSIWQWVGVDLNVSNLDIDLATVELSQLITAIQNEFPDVRFNDRFPAILHYHRSLETARTLSARAFTTG